MACVLAAGLAPLSLSVAQTPPAPVPSTPAPRPAERPNIVLILADDLGVEGLSTYGGEYRTPNLDRLAREGVRFENAHATPLCTTSRTRIMTGQENHRNYEAFAYLAPSQITFGNVLKEAGYATAVVGKWQLSGNGLDGRIGITPEQAGFDESHLWQRYPRDARGSRYWGPTHVVNGTTVIKEEGFGPDGELNFALDFIDRHKDAPFFLYFPMTLVHDPFVPTPDTLDAVGDHARWSGMIEYMDRQVGQLLARLASLGLDRNTVVIFAGDNGTNRKITSIRQGHSIPGGKGKPTVNGTHVPLIVRAPGIAPAGKVSEALFDFTDVLPTLADLAGAPLPDRPLDGHSQVPVLTGETASVRDSIFMHYAPVWQMDPARFVFDAHWKLYGDGRFVSVNSVSGVETELAVSNLKGEAAARYAEFRRTLDGMNDGPLNPEKYRCAPARPRATRRALRSWQVAMELEGADKCGPTFRKCRPAHAVSRWAWSISKAACSSWGRSGSTRRNGRCAKSGSIRSGSTRRR